MNDDMLDILAAQLSPLTHTEWMHLYNWPPGFVSVGATPPVSVGATPPGQKQQYRGDARHLPQECDGLAVFEVV